MIAKREMLNDWTKRQYRYREFWEHTASWNCQNGMKACESTFEEEEKLRHCARKERPSDSEQFIKII
jgi:hypothetical protein